MTIEDLCETWRVNNAITLKLLALCPDDTFDLKPGKGKTIRSNFVHIVSTRKMWLEEKFPAECQTRPKLDWKSADRNALREETEWTSALMERLFRLREEKGKPLMGFFAYMVAHEANHRAQIEISLRLAGREPEERALYALWDWSKIDVTSA